ncbi:MAG: radical SAM protein [Thermoplasmata archaeon]|nr:radical SAM protein [Thermoplasmata archaeon]
MLISEIFYSLQGEGILIGAPTAFVRTAGCNLRCRWCDTEYAFTEGKEMSINEIVQKVRKYRCHNVCITGGEPLIQDGIIKLLQRFLDKRYFVSVETSGSVSIEPLPCDERLIVSLDIKCPSSGEEKKMNFSNLELMSPSDQLKFVIADEGDYNYAKEIITKYTPICQIIFQPVGGLDLNDLAEKVLKDRIDARVLPQLHKLIWGDKRRV